MGKPVSVMQRTTTTSVGQLIGMLQAYPRDLPVEVGLGYRDETETYREVTVTAIGVEWLGDGPDGTVVLVIGETGMLRAS